MFIIKRFTGHCTEFNVHGGVIQDQMSTPCNNTFPKCDLIYNSLDAYKCMVTEVNITKSEKCVKRHFGQKF